MHKFLVLVRNIKVKCTFEDAKVLDAKAKEIATKLIKKTKYKSQSVDDAFIYKKSIDARKKDEIYLIYTVAFPIDTCEAVAEKGIDVISLEDTESLFSMKKVPNKPPVVVGFGPSGMFCALALAKAGLCPVVFEKGADIDERTRAVERYWKDGVLDENTNVQFGEGGAGTFSDGKLLTRISDSLCSYVLSTFVKFGAPHEIMYLAKPHIGTDNLKAIVKNIRCEIIKLGGKVYFNKSFTGFESTNDGKVKSVITCDGEKTECSALFLCIGHSARDTVKKLMKNGVTVMPKPFSVGVRIEHLQEDIDKALYGKFAGAESLGPAAYTLSRKYQNRAVYSFCMCPGGTVVASSSENGSIVTNGMSNYLRDGKNANSAIAVSVDTSDFGNTVEGAVDFQETLEKKAFELAGANASAPIQTLCDFLDGNCSHEPKRIMPTYTGKTAVRDAHDVFPKFVTDNLKLGIRAFERDIRGFSAPDAVITFPETRTSSPVKIVREKNYCAEGFSNLYPVGEGAGYAGGITSAAVDGLRCALSFFKIG